MTRPTPSPAASPAGPLAPARPLSPLRRLDAGLGRVSMYRLVLAALGVVLAVALALVLAATGTLGYPALGIVAVLAVGTLGTLAATWVGGLVTRSRPHVASSLVTGAILALVLLPGTDGRTLAGAAVAGAAAGASKYLLAWRGRHVLNPAAVGLVVVGWTGLATSGWWVGTAALLPAVAVAGGVVAWRTRRVAFVLAYAVPAFVLTAVGYLTLGVAANDALWWALTASPVAFLALFMLTEPLTSPPRRPQRLLVGALVAVLAAAPLFLEWGWLSPELALIVGNAVAFGLGLRRGVRLRLSSATLTGDVLDLHLAPSSPVRALPGQYVEIDVPQAGAAARWDPRGRRRVLSLASDPASGDVRLVTRLSGAEGSEPSPVKRALAALAPGEELRVTSVGGDFLLPSGPVALVGAGIGVTPFLAHLDGVVRGSGAAPGGASGVRHGHDGELAAARDVVLVHGVRTRADVLELPGSAGDALPAGVRLVLVVPPGTAGGVAGGTAASASGGTAGGPDGVGLDGRWEVLEGAVTDAAVLGRAVPDLGARTVLVSGSPASVDALRTAARSLGAARVRTDTFLGY
ncbi:FAD-dependent oxidoreductase [Miniimonas arenae]|uniref:FAD-dependent oxidoreductase n=1 Tax=Miniimonas arenae TaxID=676201 RepID=A0A5C5BCQ6_9MICO|nr:FAD-dependent oxidoreductase [Miniimonas arenae]TNU74871.1 FAD-dependent oxidoreductase [Miniimonas arenae]